MGGEGDGGGEGRVGEKDKEGKRPMSSSWASGSAYRCCIRKAE